MRKQFSSAPIVVLLATLLLNCSRLCADGEAWPPQSWLLNCLVKAVPGILATFDHNSGRFNAAQWSCQEQHALFPLAVAWAYEDPKNPFYHDHHLLAVIGKGGDALCAAQDDQGRLPYLRSTRGQSRPAYVPWTFSRWARCYLLVKDQLPPEQRDRWQRGLTTAFSEIHQLNQSQNGPYHAHLATALFIAGRALNQPTWQDSARQVLLSLAARQTPDGCWLGKWGPALSHNNSLIEALGLYYAVAQDPAVIDPLKRGAHFHLAVTWPDGTAVSAIDDRQPYQQVKNIGNVGFSWTAPGRLFLHQQLRALIAANHSVDADFAAAMLIFGGKGPISPMAGNTATADTFRSQDGLMHIHHQAPWRVCLSAYTAPPATQSWLLDRHNMLDIYHDALGLVAGGGNGKNQPLWSSFVFTPLSDEEDKVDDATSNTRSDIPTAAKIIDSPTGALLQLNYAKTQCRITTTLQEDGALQLSYAISAMPQPVQGEAHIPFLRRKGPLRLGNNTIIRLNDQPVTITGKDAGGSFAWGGLHVDFPAHATLHWPVFRRPATDSTPATSPNLALARLVLSVPINQQNPTTTITLRQVPENVPGLISYPAKSLSLFSPSATPAKYLKELDAVFLSANRPGESMTLKVPNKKNGRYELYVEFVMNPTYGLALVTGNGKQPGQSFDCYAPDYDSSGLIPCGDIDLAARDLVLTIRSVARNPRSTGYFLAIKAVHLRPLTTAVSPSTNIKQTEPLP